MTVKIINTVTDFPLPTGTGNFGPIRHPFELEPPEEGARLVACEIKRDTGPAPEGVEPKHMIDKTWARLIRVTAQWVINRPSDLEKELEQLKQEHAKFVKFMNQTYDMARQAETTHMYMDREGWPKGKDLIERIRAKRKPI